MGNQTFHNHEFVALPGEENSSFGDIYEYGDGSLKFFDLDQYSNLIETQMTGRPGAFAPGSSVHVPYPLLNQLKRIRISNPNRLPTKDINFMLPFRPDMKKNAHTSSRGDSRLVFKNVRTPG